MWVHYQGMPKLPFSRAASVLVAVLIMPSPVLAAQDYRRIDRGRNAVTLPAATGLPSITTMAVAPGSGFSILYGREGNVHHFDANGRLIKRIGRASDSNVTFERLHWHGWHGQLPWAQEQNADVVVVFDGGTGKVSTTIDLPRLGPAQVQALTPDGAPIVFRYFHQPPATAAQSTVGYAVLPGFGMAPKAPFARLPPAGCHVRLGDPSMPIPWCQQSLGVVEQHGEWVAIVSKARESGAGNTAVQVTFLTTRGDTLSSVRVDAPAASVAVADAAVHLRSESRSRRLSHDNELKLRSAVDAKPSYPIASWLIATNDRTVWLVQQTASAMRYIVVASAGRVVGRYSTAPNLRLMAVAGRTAFGVRTLPSGSEQVVRVTF